MSFGFYPLLEFYSIKTVGWGVADWIGFKENLDITGFNKVWFGEWYGKALLSVCFIILGVIIQQIFDQDD
ncbi:hypothetical protein ACINWC323_1518 [Acinetobacter sp. WC-323]|nr:hypothetical protein ACINWC323_1518 [Acinetobacter sp. WC-323]